MVFGRGIVVCLLPSCTCAITCLDIHVCLYTVKHNSCITHHVSYPRILIAVRTTVPIYACYEALADTLVQSIEFLNVLSLHSSDDVAEYF